MKILFEGYPYPDDVAKDVLRTVPHRTQNGTSTIDCVGYYFNADIGPKNAPGRGDCVFILPKVLLEGEGAETRVLRERRDDGTFFEGFRPEDILDLDAADGRDGRPKLSSSQKRFLCAFAVWIYRALCVFRKDHPKSDALHYQQLLEMGGRRKVEHHTLLDVILALFRFQRDNRDFFFFTVRNLHSGTNRIHWPRTVRRGGEFLQDGAPVYLAPVNRKREIDFDEELLVLFYSILRHAADEYGFPFLPDVEYELVTGRAFERYLRGYGKRRLLAIKYRYFSDKALELWELCYAFFCADHRIRVDVDRREYLLARDFEVVFEAMIDKLIGDREEDLPEDFRGLKDQRDGKRIDHLYRWEDLVEPPGSERIFYIGDSKYYKRSTPIGDEAVYKQHTYARNLIQWNINFFAKGGSGGIAKIRDDKTEGYAVVPNFFISAQVKAGLRYDQDGISDSEREPWWSSQFENRLYDRDTLLGAHYDVNFLFVLSLYARNHSARQAQWRDKMRAIFRKGIQDELSKKFKFFAMRPKSGTDPERFLRENFRDALGKTFLDPWQKGDPELYSLALDQDDRFKDANDRVKSLMERCFVVEECPIGMDPSTLPTLHSPGASAAPVAPGPGMLPRYNIAAYAGAWFIVGCIKDATHERWIFSRRPGKGSDLYNVRLARSDMPVRRGSVWATPETALANAPRFAILYEAGAPAKNRAFRIGGHVEKTQAEMEALKYDSPQGDYLCYELDEEITFGTIDVSSLLSDWKAKEPGGDDGAPLFRQGAELAAYVGGKRNIADGKDRFTQHTDSFE